MARAKRMTTAALTPLARVANRTLASRRYRALARKVHPERLPALDGPILLVHPHVDDEVIATGGQLLAWQRRGVPVDLAYTTDSSAGGLGSTPAERAATRRAEAEELQRRLGLRRVVTLSGVNERLTAMTDQVTDELADLVAGDSYRAVFAVGPVDAHHEHRTSASIIAKALVKAGYTGPVFVGENSTLLPATLITHVAPLSRADLRDRDALLSIFASQTSMGFEVYHDLTRAKRHLAPGAWGAELFHRTDAAGLGALVDAVEASDPARTLPHRIGNSWSLWRVLRLRDLPLPTAQER